jgi:trans-aconitate 2-methyltransferase
MSWDPKQYLRYSNERLRPAQDLLARVAVDAPRTIVDLGCGAGNVTALLGDRWPHARIVGVDNSNEMLAKARASTAGDARFEWIEADMATWAPKGPVDVVYSNAALHWQDDHARLFPRLFDWVAPGGTLAVQMPDNFAAPSHTAIAEVVATPRWRDRLGALHRTWPVQPAAAYFRLLAAAERVDAWTTEYLHVLPASTDDVHPVVAWVKGTTLTPFLAVLDAAAQRAFIGDVSARVATAYPALPDGRVLFAFRRVFVVASRAIRAFR